MIKVYVADGLSYDKKEMAALDRKMENSYD
jgi:hypothetical protein